MFCFPVKNAVANLDAVAGELCKLAELRALSSPTPCLQSDAACQRLAGAARYGIKDSACLVSVPCAEKCWSTPPSPPSLLKSVLLFP